MNSKQVDDKPSGEQLSLPEPDRDNITVLTNNLPNKPILPWHHYDSPWRNGEEEELNESDTEQPTEELCEEQLAATAEFSETEELVELSHTEQQTEQLCEERLTVTVEFSETEELVDYIEQETEELCSNQPLAKAEQTVSETVDDELRQLG
ncbi:hypothetical protein [Lyngbya aestuarii]|uniref:hypothetical protein n=1 Tax=Lyngbya aestuarii TaxID=118322 RepID=UPI00403E3466